MIVLIDGGCHERSTRRENLHPCRGGIPPLTRAEAEELLPQAPEWALMDNAHRIEKTFRFGNFGEALAFAQKVGELAEAEGHHPDISFGWGYGTVSLRTKKIKGLHENDHHGGKDRSVCANGRRSCLNRLW
jgi:4a-hydroxytetrahydrobiopterin dehydratase